MLQRFSKLSCTSLQCDELGSNISKLNSYYSDLFKKNEETVRIKNNFCTKAVSA